MVRDETSSVISETVTVVFETVLDDDFVDGRITPSRTGLRGVVIPLTRGLAAFVFTATGFAFSFFVSRKTTSDPSLDIDIVFDPFFATLCGVVGGRFTRSLDSLLVNGARLVVGLVVILMVGVDGVGAGLLNVVIQSLSLSCLVGVRVLLSWYNDTTPYNRQRQVDLGEVVSLELTVRFFP
jgi:hypothetical protein